MTRIQSPPPSSRVQSSSPKDVKEPKETKELAEARAVSSPVPAAAASIADALGPPVADGAVPTGFRFLAEPPAVLAETVKQTLLPLCAQIESGVEPPESLEPSPPAMLNPTALQDQPPNVGDLFDGLAALLGKVKQGGGTKGHRAAERLVDKLTLAMASGEIAKPPATQAPKPLDPELAAKVADLSRPAPAPKRPGTPAPAGTSGAVAAPAPFEEIVIPGPELVKLESLAVRHFSSGFDFSQMDVETAVAIVMFQLGEEADRDLRDLLKEMDASRVAREAKRREISAVRAQQSAAKDVLRNEYNARRALPEDDPQFIPPSVSFDDYAAQRTLGFPLNADGAFDGSQAASFAFPGPLFPPPPADAPASTDAAGGVSAGGVSGGSGTSGAAAGSGVGSATPATPEQAALAASLGLSPEAVVATQAVYDGLQASLGDFLPSFDVFLKDPSWLADMFSDVMLPPNVAGAKPLAQGGKASDNLAFVQALLRTVETEILNPENFRAHVDAAYETALVTDFFLTAQKDTGSAKMNEAMGKLEAAHADAQARFDKLAAAGRSLHGTEFTRALANDQIAIFEQLRREVAKLVPGGANHGEKIGDGLFVKVGNAMKDHPGAALGLGLAGGAVSAVVGTCLLVGASLARGDLEALNDYASDPLIVEFVATAAEYEIGVGQINDMLKVKRGDEEDATRAFFGDAGRKTGKGHALEEQKKAADKEALTPGMASEVSDDVEAALAALAPKKGTVAGRPVSSRPAAERNVTAQRLAGAPSSSSVTKRGTIADFQAILDADKDALDSMNELNDARQMRLQMYLDRKSKIATTLSNVVKKLADTSANITGNMK